MFTGLTTADPGLDEPVDPIQEIYMCNVTNLNKSNVTITFDAHTCQNLENMVF